MELLLLALFFNLKKVVQPICIEMAGAGWMPAGWLFQSPASSS